MAANNDKATDISECEFNETINNGSETVIIDFYAEWCMPCLIIEPVIEELANKFSQIKFARVNVDENQNLSSKFSINSIPCIIVFKQGKEVERILGALPQEVLEEKINKHIKPVIN